MSGRTYSAEEKASALELYAAEGGYRAATQTGFPRSTIMQWARKAGVRPPAEHLTEDQTARMAKKAADVAEGFIDLAAICIERAKSKDTAASAVQSLTVAAATSYDKYRLSQGQTTGHEKVTIDDIAGSRERLAQQLARIASRRGAEESACELN